MRRSRILLAVLAVVTLGVASAGAGVIFEERFDTYTAGDFLSSDSAGVWLLDGCNDAKVATDNPVSAPNTATDYKDGSNYRLGIRNRHNLTATEMANADVQPAGTPTSVNGTDDNPLVFQFALYLGPKTSPYYYLLNAYAELTCGDERAPTTMLVADCSGKVRPHLNLNGDGQPHRSIAVGQIAWSDTDPCDTPASQVAQQYRLVLYDGSQWHILQSPVDVHTCSAFNYVTIRVKTSTIVVELSTLYNGTNCDGPRQTLTTTVSRSYTGPFTAIKFGGLSDETNGGCWGQDKGDVGYPAQQTVYDEVYLSGGVALDTLGPCDAVGACCTGHACQQLTPTACAAIEGATFQGSNTICWVGAGKCCGSPAVDFDFDKDVDMIDFANLQRCLTIGAEAPVTPLNECSCFDVDGTPGIGADDVDRFVLCGSGASVAAAANCLP